jgi:aminocarboxymuconate-semialdehyde decarboxylase
MIRNSSRIGFVGCDLLRAPAEGGGHDHPHRREVAVNGTRIRTVDIHAHCAVPEANAVLGKKVGRNDLLMSDRETRLAAMDAQGLDIAALSINPYWYDAGRDESAEVIRIQNEALAEICAETPDRFVAFATIALQHPDLAVEQIRYAVKELGLQGVSIGCSVEGEELANERFHPVWQICDEMNLLVFMHPQGTRELQASGRLAGSGALGNTIGNPLETTIALSHLIFEGTLDAHPGLKICAVHGGGYFASYAHRSDVVCSTGWHNADPKNKKPPTSYLRDGQLYFDSLVFTPKALRHLAAETGPDKIMIGTDYPFGWTDSEVDLVMNTPELSDDDRVAILGGTAAKLLGLSG